MNNKVYDILKWITLVALPATTTLWLALSTVWGWEYREAIAGTLTAITAFLGTILGVSSVQYQKKLNGGSEK